MSMTVDFHLDGDDDRAVVAFHTYTSPHDFSTLEMRNGWGDKVTVYSGSPDQARDFAAALVAAARDLDQWADTVDPAETAPAPETAADALATLGLIGLHEGAAS